MPNPTSVSLNTNLDVPLCGSLRDRLDSQRWRIGMGSNHSDTVANGPIPTNGECNHGRAITRGEVFLALENLAGPIVPL
ncbi:hypothetical protein WICPIJ_006713 [Wickerhamomyces pijperi]|uniref:Uncharacterized protein n=1 Tax=Wickerhamomyces pijperi TaxID=599730 RepID=A0A9P8TL58_WICPI|nr:hypothetical protein WICPIJ_006713 [Wickerhamomyces pijperi]